MQPQCNCTCHKIPGCQCCSDCYVVHGVSLRQWKNELEEKSRLAQKLEHPATEFEKNYTW